MLDTKKFIKVVNKVIESLGKLDEDQLQAILDGKAEFIVKVPDTDPAERMKRWKRELESCDSHAQGVAYISSNLKNAKGRLTRADLLAFAEFCDCPLDKRKKIDALVEDFVSIHVDPLINQRVIRNQV